MRQLFITSIALTFTFFSLGQFDISYEKVGELKLGSSVQDVEKLSGTTFTMPIDDFEAKFNTSVKGNTFQITFQEKEVDKVKSMILQRIATKDPKYKTKEGAKVGMSKTELLDLYKNFYSYQMHRSYDDETWTYSTNKFVFDIDKKYNETEVNFEDFTDYRILFYIENDIVTEIAVLNGYFL
ncbi:MAG: hypothetical protein ACKO7D_01540 [Bacteroidota bacterium]